MSFQKLAIWFRKRDVNNFEKNGFQHSQCMVSKQKIGLYVESKLTNVELRLLLQLFYVDLIFACFYLTGQLKSILQKFELARVVLVVLNPHVFNLTGQLESKSPEFPTLAATDLISKHLLLNIDFSTKLVILRSIHFPSDVPLSNQYIS
jgi:hypothetical protein